ncbi:MAG: hypothetical protein ACKN9K_21475, partial [Dolichospermum sp.]
LIFFYSYYLKPMFARWAISQYFAKVCNITLQISTTEVKTKTHKSDLIFVFLHSGNLQNPDCIIG